MAANLPPDVLAQIEALLQGIGDIRATQYAACAALTLWTYDTLLNLSREVQYVWTSRVTWGQALYLINRYFSAAVLFFGVACNFRPIPTPNFCDGWPYFELFSGMATVLMVQSVLMVRVIAIFARRMSVLCIVVGGCIIEVISILAIGIPLLKATPFTTLSLPPINLTACVPVNGLPSYAYTFWIVPLAFDFVLFGLVIFRARDEILGHSTTSSSGINLLRILARDSTLMFFYNLCAQLTFLLLWRIARPGLLATPSEVGNAIDIILATRLLLNLWDRYSVQTDPTGGVGSRTLVTNDYEMMPKGVQPKFHKSKEQDTFWAMRDDDDGDFDLARTLRETDSHAQLYSQDQ